MRAASPGLSGWIVRGPTRECPGVLESREWEDAHIIVDLARIEVQDLLAAKRDLKLSGLFKRLSRYEVLVHHCVIVELNVPSYRVEQTEKGRPPAATEQSPADASGKT
jgi:hypothetical protein